MLYIAHDVPDPFGFLFMTKAILLVEDNFQDEKLIFRALGKIGLADQVEVMRDGQQALDYLFREGEFHNRPGQGQPNVVLLDINMPKVGGIEVLKRIKSDSRTRLIPVVILTSSDDPGDRQSCYGHGANSFVQKPVDYTEFAECLKHLAVYWRGVNSPPF